MDYCSQLCIQFDFYYIGYFESFYTCKVYIEATLEGVYSCDIKIQQYTSFRYLPPPRQKKQSPAQIVRI